MASWRGDEVKLRQLCQMFEAASSSDTQVQQQVMQSLGQFSQLPDFNMYLVAVFSEMRDQPEVVRQRAGLTLKNSITQMHAGSLQQQVSEHINSRALSAMEDHSQTVRHTAGTILTTMVQKMGITSCGTTLENLVNALKNQNHGVVEGSLSALSKICEDEMGLLERVEKLSANQQSELQLFIQWSGSRLLPQVFEVATPGAPDFARQLSLEILNHFALNGAFSDPKFGNLHQYGQRYIEVLGVLANDQKPGVLQNVCKGFASAVEKDWNCLTDQHYDVILKFMAKACQNPEYGVRFEALAVWVPCTEMYQTWGTLKTLLPELVPVLLTNMVYSNADYECMEASQLEEDNADVPDKLDDIKPRFNKEGKNNVDAEDDDDNSRQSTSGWGAEWTVRKAAAKSLDCLSQTFNDEIKQLVLPLIEQKLQNASWEHQEAGVLALGAIAYGCHEELVQFLPAVIELLLKMCHGQKPLLRSISCWTTSRFGRWICNENNPNREQILRAVLRTLLPCCLDRNKRVQEAAVSALATLEESATIQLVPYLNEIIQTLVNAFRLYQTKNFRILYDAIGTLVWNVGYAFDRPEYINAIMNPLMQKFETVPDNDITTLALFECLSYIVHTLGKSVAVAVPKIVQRCVRIVSEVSRAAQLWEQNPNEYERPDRELMAAAVDLLTGIIEGFQQDTKEVLMQQNFLVVLPDAIQDKSQRVKQSAFALMGTCAQQCAEPLFPHLPTLLPLCKTGLANGMTPNVSNNASWAIGEICLKVNQNVLTPYLDDLVPALVGVLHRREGVDFQAWQRGAHSMLVTNICITLGRLGLVCAPTMGKLLPSFMAVWCQVMANAHPDAEKARAFMGLVKMIQENSAAGSQCFPQLAIAIGTFCPVPPALGEQLKGVLESYKAAFGQNWPAVWGSIPQPVQQRLVGMYSITA